MTQLLLAALALAFVASGGCSRMSEGERCDFANAGDADCDDGLVCVPAKQLVNNGNGADRCCPPVNETQNDSRCVRGSPVPGAGGTGGSGGSSAGAAGQSAAGMGGAPGGGEGGQPPSGTAGEAGMSNAGSGGV